jgi:hypothetical protein
MVSLYSNGAVDIAALMRLAIEYPAEFLRLLKTALYALLVETALIPARRILRSRLALADGGKSLWNPAEQFARSEYSRVEWYLAPGRMMGDAHEHCRTIRGARRRALCTE